MEIQFIGAPLWSQGRAKLAAGKLQGGEVSACATEVGARDINGLRERINGLFRNGLVVGGVWMAVVARFVGVAGAAFRLGVWFGRCGEFVTWRVEAAWRVWGCWTQARSRAA